MYQTKLPQWNSWLELLITEKEERGEGYYDNWVVFTPAKS